MIVPFGFDNLLQGQDAFAANFHFRLFFLLPLFSFFL